MKKIFRFAFEATSFLLLVALVFVLSVFKLVKADSQKSENKEGGVRGVSFFNYKAALNYALADTPAGTGTGGVMATEGLGGVESCEGGAGGAGAGAGAGGGGGEC